VSCVSGRFLIEKFCAILVATPEQVRSDGAGRWTLTIRAMVMQSPSNSRYLARRATPSMRTRTVDGCAFRDRGASFGELQEPLTDALATGIFARERCRCVQSKWVGPLAAVDHGLVIWRHLKGRLYYRGWGSQASEVALSAQMALHPLGRRQRSFGRGSSSSCS
jgi:hypothetical protein